MPVRRQQDKVERIMRILDQLHPQPPIPLLHEDPFTLLVAVVLSAQTTDKKVNQVTPRLFSIANTPKQMAALSESDVREFIREVGLAPQKAKALVGLSKLLITRHEGRVPSDFESLVELPGVGRKTANVVLAQAFGIPAFPVDTHIHRLAGRWGLSSARTADGTERDLCKLFPRASWSKVHLQMIYFGREHCPALRHEYERCPICSWAVSKRSRTASARNQSRLEKRRAT